MDIEKIKKAKTQYIGKNIEYFEKLDSTQIEAKRNINKYKNGTIVIADIQTRGKGTHGRLWYTNDNNIAMTIILKPYINIRKMKNFTIKIAEIIKDAVYELYKIRLEIKIPNDLLLNNKKICGILTEVKTINEEVKELFIGVGFNVNERNFPPDIVDVATSLYKENNKVYSKEEIICKIIEGLEIELKNMMKINL